jgi:predicted ATPase
MKHIKHFENYNNIINMKIVLTGSPGTGKSSVADKLSELGYNVVVEPARELIEEFKISSPEKLPWNNHPMFVQAIEDKNVENFHNNNFGFFDRSIVDLAGFLIKMNIEISDDLKRYCSTLRYDKVFIFKPWREIYTTDSVRRETFEDCLELDKHLVMQYKLYGYNPIEVINSDVDSRVQFILKNLN